MEKKPISHYVAGLIIGLISIISFLAVYFMGHAFQKDFVSYIPSIIMVGLIIYFIVKWANDKDNYVTFGQCFGYGFKATMILTLLLMAFMLVFILTSPDMKSQFTDAIRQSMASNKDISDEQKEQSLQMMSDHFMLIMLGGVLLANLFYGAIAAIIGAAVAKKKPIDPFVQQQIPQQPQM